MIGQKTKRCKTVYPHCLIKCIKNGVQKVGKRTQKKKERKKERKLERKEVEGKQFNLQSKLFIPLRCQ